eukprot:Em0001g2046a
MERFLLFDGLDDILCNQGVIIKDTCSFSICPIFVIKRATCIVSEILSHPVNQPLSPIESQLQTNLVKRSLLSSPTKGLNKFLFVNDLATYHDASESRAGSVQFSFTESTKRRTQSLGDIRRYVSANDSLSQLSREVMSCTHSDRSKLLQEISAESCVISVSTADALAMRTELNIPWHKFRALKRWLKMWQIEVASEKKMRLKADDLLGDNIIKPAPLAYIPHLWDRVENILEQSDAGRIHRLTWHNGAIPPNEIWIKVGGDKGRHCCLYCLTTSDELHLQPSIESLDLRTIDSILHDHRRFMQCGGDRRKAKEFNNVIHEPFFKSIPLSQVCPPGLHITLGIFLKLFVLMEDHKYSMPETHCGDSYKQYCSDVKMKQEVMEKLHIVKENIQMLEEILFHHLSLTNEELADGYKLVIEDICLDISEMKTREEELTSLLTTVDKRLEKDFHKNEGPFVKALDTALASFHVQRQAYYSGTFVGNHVHKALKLNNTEKLCRCLVSIAENHCPLLKAEVESISDKYLTTFSLFRKCHCIYAKNLVTDMEINELALGEQGVESIHHYFKRLALSYNAVRNPAQKLLLMLKEHMLHVTPENISARPNVKKKRKSK